MNEEKVSTLFSVSVPRVSGIPTQNVESELGCRRQRRLEPDVKITRLTEPGMLILAQECRICAR